MDLQNVPDHEWNYLAKLEKLKYFELKKMQQKKQSGGNIVDSDYKLLAHIEKAKHHERKRLANLSH